ncbi:MAG: hypothetical protein ACK56F_10940, partial [bacterium]
LPRRHSWNNAWGKGESKHAPVNDHDVIKAWDDGGHPISREKTHAAITCARMHHTPIPSTRNNIINDKRAPPFKYSAFTDSPETGSIHSNAVGTLGGVLPPLTPAKRIYMKQIVSGPA